MPTTLAATPTGPLLVGPSVGLSIWEGIHKETSVAAAPLYDVASVSVKRAPAGARRAQKKVVRVPETPASAPAARKAGRGKKSGAKRGDSARSWRPKGDQPGALEKLFLPDVPLTRSGVSDLLDSMTFTQPAVAVA